MTENDFSTNEKCLNVIQKLQAESKASGFWVNKYIDQGDMWFTVAVFLEDEDFPQSFSFHSHYTARDRFLEYNKLMGLLATKTETTSVLQHFNES